MDLIVPNLNDFTMESFAVSGEMDSLSLTTLLGVHRGSQQAPTGGKLATVGVHSLYHEAAPVRSLSDLPDISDSVVPADNVPSLSREQLTMGPVTQMAPIPRQQSHPMGSTTPEGSFSLNTGASFTSEYSTSPDATTPQPMFDAQFHLAEVERQQRLAVERLENARRQREITELGQSRFMETSASSSEQEMDDAAFVIRPAASAIRTPTRRTRRRQATARRAAFSSPSANSSRRMANQWPDHILDLETKELNKYLKARDDLSQADIKQLKTERRRKLNRQYAMTSRHRRKVSGGDSPRHMVEDEVLSEGVFNDLLVVPSQAA